MEGVVQGPAIQRLEMLKSKRPKETAELFIELFLKEQQCMVAIANLMEASGAELDKQEMSTEYFTGKYVAVGPSTHFKMFSSRNIKLSHFYVMCEREEESGTLIPVAICSSISVAKKNNSLTDRRAGATFETVSEVLTIEEAAKFLAGSWLPSWQTVAAFVAGVGITYAWASRRPPVLPSPVLAVGTTRV